MFFNGKREASLPLVYRIRVSRIRERAPATKTPQTRAHRASPWRWAIGGYCPLESIIYCTRMSQNRRILLQAVLLDSTDGMAETVVSRSIGAGYEW